MNKVVYVLFYLGEPRHAYTSIEPLYQQCHKYFDKYYYREETAFFRWVEDRDYPEDAQDRAWEDYIEWVFENGEWGDYTYTEVSLD